MAYTDIDKPSDYFNTKLYTGTGGTQAITGVGFQPDWVWLKARSSAYSHQLFDVVRGATKLIASEETSAEQTLSGVTAFGSDGFTVGSDAGSNNNTTTFASWNWLAGGSASSNSNGSITSSVSANTTAGFSIVSYTGNGSAGATIGHGLGVTPAMIIQKIRSSTGNWLVYHHKNTSAPETDFLRLNISNATADEVTIFNDTAPTSSVFSVGTENTINGNGVTCIAYCFAEIKGYSKFGSYTGNGNADGPMVYTGFKPAWLMVKNTNNNARNWTIIDNKRNPFNPEDEWLYANESDSTFDASSFPTDFVSNGFKIRNTGSYFNTSGENYIYMAFAESPFVNSNGVSNNAR